MVYVLYTPTNLKPFPYVREQLKRFFQKKETRMNISRDLSLLQEILEDTKEEGQKFPETTPSEKELKLMIMEEDKIDNIVDFLKLYEKEASEVINEIVQEIKENR